MISREIKAQAVNDVAMVPETKKYEESVRLQRYDGNDLF
jgi:hypothetical protein